MFNPNENPGFTSSTCYVCGKSEDHSDEVSYPDEWERRQDEEFGYHYLCCGDCVAAADAADAEARAEELMDDYERERSIFDLSDDAEALASAGMGTDEDYGYFGGEDY